MRVSKTFFKTYREDPSDAEIDSHKLLVRGGFIKKQSMGVYAYMPMGTIVLEKIKNIIREEMNRAGAIEVTMPMLLPLDVYAGRLDKFGKTMFQLKDSQNRDYCLGPTHEEVFTLAVKDYITSYKQLPVTLYQIQTKFRDELRPRFGLQRAREFVMKDAYSYDKDYAGLDASFDAMDTAYRKIFDRLGLDYVSVEADNGTMGGKCSREFMVKSNVGEDELAVCDHCGYAGNVEKATSKFEKLNISTEGGKLQKVATQNLKTIEDLAHSMNTTTDNFLKCVVYNADGKIVAVFLRGDREIEEIKLINYLKANNLEMASSSDIASIGSVPGYIGARGLKNVLCLADLEVQNMHNFVMGANELDYHYEHVNLDDCHFDDFIDLRKVVAGDLCENCGHKLRIIRGIEVGHIFKLGEVYTKRLNCTYLDEQGKQQTMVMGCYGIGVSRTLSALVEQYHDEKGIIFPKQIAPYQVAIVTANQKDDTIASVAEDLYNKLNSCTDTLYDDRKESMGVKMKDMELIGIPYIIVVGRDAKEGIVEVICRANDEKTKMSIDEAVKKFEVII